MKLAIISVTLVIVILVQLSFATPQWKRRVEEISAHVNDKHVYGRDLSPGLQNDDENTHGTGGCPDGAFYFCKYRWTGSDYQYDGGIGGSLSVTITSGDAISGTWISTGWVVKAIIVKGGSSFAETNFDPAITNGTFDNTGLPLPSPDILWVRFCGLSESSSTTASSTTSTTSTMTTTHPTTTTTHSTTTQDNDNCHHEVNITINNYNSLVVNSFNDGTIFEFCQTSTYLGPNTAVVLGFDPYVTCHLNERGTCDNKHSVHFPQNEICATDPRACMYPCVGDDLGISFKIDGLSDNLQWDTSVADPIFIEDDTLGVAHLFGYLKDPVDSQIKLHVTIWLNDLYPVGIIPSGSPVKNLLQQCYVGNANPNLWSYYHTVTGSITGVPGSAYDGLIISVQEHLHSPQVGYGANGQNTHAGVFVEFLWSVVHQPYDVSLELTASLSSSFITIDLTEDCLDPEEYCGLFGEPDQGAVNGWTVSLNETTSLITYCANFTMEDLLNCRAFGDHYTSLFTVIEESSCENCIIVYNGQLYQSTILGDNCGNWSEGLCDEVIALSSCYNITLELDSGGSIDVSFLTNDIDFWVQWLYNVWLCGEDAGNLKVVLKTRICQGGDPEIKLCNPLVDVSTETGYPLVFVDPLDPPCHVIGDFCYQTWTLRTFDAHDVEDFSGFKLLKWDVCKNDVVVGHVSANHNLHAKHIGSQIHLDGKVNAAVTFYTDSYFDQPYNSMELVDCEHLYGKVCLTNHEHLDAEIRKAYICFSPERDLIPFNPMDPGHTGCNTPGDDVVKILIYSTNPWDFDIVPENLHDFQIIPHGDMDNSCEFFKFTVLAYTPYKQVLQIVWCAHEDGGFGGLVESISEYRMDDGFFSRTRREHQEGEHAFTVHCPSDSFFDWTAHRCHTTHHHHRNDDEGDDDDHDELGDFDDVTTFLSIIFLLILFGLLFCCCSYFHAWYLPPHVDYAPSIVSEEQTMMQVQKQQQQQTINVNNNNYVNTSQEQSQSLQQQKSTKIYDGGYIPMTIDSKYD
jgi:hypothetical protein